MPDSFWLLNENAVFLGPFSGPLVSSVAIAVRYCYMPASRPSNLSGEALSSIVCGNS